MPEDLRTNGHTIVGHGTIAASETEIDWGAVRREVGE